MQNRTMELLIVRVQIGSVEKKYRRTRSGAYSLVGPVTTGEPTTRSKLVLENICFFGICVVYPCLSVAKILDRTETGMDRGNRKVCKKVHY